MKNGDVLTVTADYHGLIRLGYNNHAFLRFCLNHVKPFGFRWESQLESPVRCSRCGDQFIEDRQRSFVMITHGYTVTQAFRNGDEVYSAKGGAKAVIPEDILDAEVIED